MDRGFEFWMAVRYLRVRSQELFISMITWISVAGVAIGVASLIIVMAVMGGFEADLRDKILGANAQIRILPTASTQLTDWQGVSNAALAVEGVRGATPYVDAQVMLMARGRVQGVQFRGVDPATVNQVLELDNYVVKGGLDGFEGNRPPVLVGSEMAKNWGLYVGDDVKVVSPEQAMTPAGPIPRFRMFRVAGIFTTGMYDYDTGVLFARLNDARDFLRMDSGVSGVELSLHDVFDAPQLAAQLAKALPEGYKVRDWTEMNRSLFEAMKLEQIAMILILGLIVVVAAFNIASTLIMVVMEKSRDIGVLKAMGASNSSVRRIFVFEGGVIGVTGTVIGGVGGVLISLLLEKYKFLRLPSDVYYIETLPVELDPVLIGIVAVCAVALCLLATLYPSWQASRLDPVETIRYE